MRLYCGLASAGQRIPVAVVDDAGRLLASQEVDDTPTGYAAVCTLIAERCTDTGPVRAAMATDSETNLVPLLLAAAGEPLAVGDAGTVAQFVSDEPTNGSEAQRRAVALARALQAGTLAAVSQPAPRDLAALRPVLTAHRAATAGRTASVAMLRDLLRELYPAALRAFPDPGAPLALAILERLPDPAQVTNGQHSDLAGQLREAGHRDAEPALAALRGAVAEMSVRRPVTEAVGATVRSGVAAVRSSESAAAALVGVIATQVEPRTGGRGFPAVPPATTPAAPVSGAPAPVSGAPVSGMPVSAAPVSAAPVPVGAPVSGSPAAPGPVGPPSGAPLGATGANPTKPAPANGVPAYQPRARHEPAAPVSASPVFAPPASGPPLSAPLPLASQPLASQPPPAAPSTATAPPTAEPPVQTGAQHAVPQPASAPPAPQPPAPQPPAMMPPAPQPPAMMPPAPPPEAQAPTMMPPAPAPPSGPQPAVGTPYSGPPVTGGFPTSAGWAPHSGPRHTTTTEPSRSTPYGPLNPPHAPAQPLAAPAGSAVPDQSDEELSLLTPDELPTSSDLRRPPEPGQRPSEPTSGRLGALIEFPRSARRSLREQQPPSYGEQARRDTEDEPTQEYRPPSPRRQPPAEAPSSSPPLSENDGDLLIFAQARSAWFTGEPEADGDRHDWRTEADAGWSAAEAASRPTVGGTTVSGLPRRVPSANLVPGAAPNRERAHVHPINRDAAQLAAHTAGYFRGWNRARQDSQEPPFPSVRHQ